MTVLLEGIDLVVFDKDGTLIEFDSMWAGWADTLVASLEVETGRPIAGPLQSMLGYDPETGVVRPGGGLAATPMARLRERTLEVLVGAGVEPADAERSLEAAWHAPDPVALARPVTDLHALFARLHAAGCRIALATSDDREPTERTLDALGLTHEIDAVVCADDGPAVKPAGEMVLHLCAAVGVAPGRTAVVGDAPADLQMARAAGAGLTIGVLTGVGRRADLEPLADAVIASVEELRMAPAR